MPAATPSVKHETKPFIKKIKKWVAAITLLITVCCLGFFIIWWINSECVQGDCVNGVGTYTWSDGDKYVGEWQDEKKHGQGTYTTANGDKYVGEYKNGKSNGQGTYTWSDGDKYVGEWQDDNFNGQGTYTFADGSAQKSGLWKNGKFVEWTRLN